ncbi:MAG TPA: NifB/NifX family molybdenum-iron cluster-binding protein [Candidatus Hydrogenedentes bacterium]|nr:NifB/NifX family molybdenum-iron cluster-binding protein [Candidatus Hydrogenedentota bacterium]HOV74032.1 NifB/NifX family molybdenum-iron cluster-binding protein [Candidatus Hydrogenedentota bacterium]HPC15982.1 NifB/NifX family molybdenum-iron cluster-binding protein [Candidatus Hydrogenedentota bacterium]HRT19936.1 NifB/NifX family molybdenum-iron cluster-binding protein [Candidatus Hydrogenedentota bacterium]HRT64614.1 NifB/NifX family molybdenum-iron cluster-binding protein [Candidatus
MIIVVSASGKTLDAQVDPRFGRAAFFIAVDSESGAFQAHDNVQNLSAAQGAGIQSAETVSRLGADVVITGNCGPKAFRTLSAAGIKVIVGGQGTVAEAIEAFKSGTLVPADAPNVEGHWA